MGNEIITEQAEDASAPGGSAAQEPETFRIPAANIGSLRQGIARLSDRARKLGSPPITLREVRVEDVIETVVDGLDGLAYPTGRVLRFHIVEVVGEAPKFAGWTFVASLDLLDGGTMLRAVPGETVPTAYRTATPGCDHCRLTRNRLKHYLLRHDSGEHKQVGSSCLKDFLGHEDPGKLARLAQYLSDALSLAEAADVEPGDHEFSNGAGGGRSHLINLETFLAYVAAEIRAYGWVSRKMVDESVDRKTSTATMALSAMFPLPGRGRSDRDVLPVEADYVEARATIEWAQALPENGTDYEHNLRVVAASPALDFKHTGLTASAVAGYQREQERLRLAKRQAARPSQHFGEIGKRAEFVLEVLGSKILDGGQWGPTELWKFVDAQGNEAAWFSTRAGAGLAVGKTYRVKATVKKHEHYSGRAQTTLTRLVILGEQEKVATVPTPATVPATGGGQ